MDLPFILKKNIYSASATPLLRVFPYEMEQETIHYPRTWTDLIRSYSHGSLWKAGRIVRGGSLASTRAASFVTSVGIAMDGGFSAMTI